MHSLQDTLSRMAVVIPTYMREDRQKAYNSIPPEIRKHVTLFTHSGRADLLRKHEPKADVHDLVTTDGIADVRQKILDVVGMGYDKVLIIDDRCQFMTSSVVEGKGRKPAGSWIRGETALQHWTHLLGTIERRLEVFPQIGISPRPGNNRHVEPWMTPGRAYSVYGINIKWLRQLGIRFDGMYQKDNRVKLYEDFYLTLSLLTRGIPNAVWFEYCFQTDHGKGGGNSHYRNNDTQKLCAEALQREFPAYVKVVQREAKTFKIAGQQEFRWEVMIQWKKALMDAYTKQLL
jgi:hypothetical protein